MNKRQRKEFEANRHEMYMFKAAWLAFVGREMARIKSPNVKNFVEGLDGAVHAAVEAIVSGEVVSLEVTVWRQTDMFEALENAAMDDAALEDFFSKLADLDEQRRIDEELRRQQDGTDPYPF